MFEQIVEDVDTCIISHFAGVYPQKDKDVFFGNLVTQPEIAPLVVFLINHTTTKVQKLQSNLVELGLLNYRVLPAVTSLLGGLCELAYLTHQAIKMYFHTTFARGLNEPTRLLSLGASVYQNDLSHLHNKLIVKDLVTCLSNLKPKKVIATLEGHCFEMMLDENMRGLSFRTKMFFYQFAPVVPDQVGFFRNLKNLSATTTILASGPITAAVIQKYRPAGGVVVLGSPKGYVEELSINNTTHIRKYSCMFVPEGTIYASKSMYDFVRKMAVENPEREFIFRFHPATPNLIHTLAVLEFELPSNITLSSGELLEDFRNSKYVVYRSSSTVIDAIRMSCIPLHFQDSDWNLDPLKLLGLTTLSLTTDSKFNDIEKFVPSKNYKNLLHAFGHDYFAPLDPSVL
jgi:hypothetical protein